MRSRRILGDIHDRQSMTNGEGDGLLSRAQHQVERPILRILPNRTRPDEGATLDGKAHFLRDVNDRLNIGAHRARGAVGADREAGVHNLLRQSRHRLNGVRPSARQPQIRRLDPQARHQVQDLDLLLNGGIGHRWRLQAIAQRLVIELDLPQGRDISPHAVPIVDERMLIHSARLLCSAQDGENIQPTIAGCCQARARPGRSRGSSGNPSSDARPRSPPRSSGLRDSPPGPRRTRTPRGDRRSVGIRASRD
ncbi:hypothetical protein HRbin08_02104 [bacterium HR08]|nr:hypothetical protein HRbin08_02104 [bacterium HR08]